MSHFKYEIDERNIRLQLKAMEMPFSEEAWQKFESYSSTHSSLAAEASVKRFQFSLNRNVILPTVFGAVIVSFSLLLFNFVNIKDPNPVNDERAEASQVITEEPATPVKKEAAPQIKVEEPAPAPVVKEPVRETARPVEKIRESSQPTTEPDRVAAPETTNVKETPSVGIRITKSRDSVMENGEVQTIKTEVPTRKRNKKRSVITITEPAAGEDEQAPPPAEEPAPGE
jgi:hypothetical protein